MTEYGGYLPLELENGNERFQTSQNTHVERFNCGRNAIAAAALSLPDVCLWIPYYVCEVVADALRQYHIPFKKYYLDDKLEPIDVFLQENEWLLYVNYFGIASSEKINAIATKFKRVIFDNTQAFYTDPVLDSCCFNVYSPRKFVGLCDGAYLVWSGSRIVNMDYPQDVSWHRATFLFKSIELGTNAAYHDNLESKIPLSDGIKRMSVLTQRMLCSFNYDRATHIRDRNYRLMIELLKEYNQFALPLDGFAPFVYPLYVERDDLRNRLVHNKIYVPQWWKYLLGVVPDDSIEAKLSRWLCPLPIDQRYDEENMKQIADIVIKCLSCKSENT